MNKLKQIIRENIKGKDLNAIAVKLDVSNSKLNSYLRGNGKDEIEDKKIVDTCISYLVEKYKGVLLEIDMNS